MSRRHGVAKRLTALAAGLGFTDVRVTELGHLQFLHPTGGIVTTGTRAMGERKAAAALKRHSRAWQQMSPSPSSPARTP